MGDMVNPIGRRRLVLPLLLAAVLAALPGRSAATAEISAFATGGKPGDTWNTGFGGMLTITLFSFVNGEIEGCWQGSSLPDTNIGTLSGKAYLGPPIGRFVPYAGLGIGGYRESLPTQTDQGTIGLVFVGAKLKFPFGLVIRGEYQWTTLPKTILVPLDARYFVALGISF